MPLARRRPVFLSRTLIIAVACASQRLAAQAPFDSRFEATFGRAPGAGAEDGYRAMAGVLRAIETAGAAGNDRTRVIDSY